MQCVFSSIERLFLYRHQFEGAQEKFELSLRLAKTVNDHEGHSDALIQLAAVAEQQQNIPQRQKLLTEAASVLRQNNIAVTGWLQENGF